MATILRDWCYRYQWLFDLIVEISALSVGGEPQFRKLPMQGLNIASDDRVLDLCCGSGQATRFLVERSRYVVGLDCDPIAIERAKQRVPNAQYIQAWAEDIPCGDGEFDLVHTSATLHEMQPSQMRQILREVYRVLKPGGCFSLIDFHLPNNWLLQLNLYLFLWLFENETAWYFIRLNLPQIMAKMGFQIRRLTYPAGGSLQVIHAYKI